MNNSDVFSKITQMLSQLTQVQEDLIALKQELIDEQLSPSSDQEGKVLSSISPPIQKLPF